MNRYNGEATPTEQVGSGSAAQIDDSKSESFIQDNSAENSVALEQDAAAEDVSDQADLRQEIESGISESPFDVASVGLEMTDDELVIDNNSGDEQWKNEYRKAYQESLGRGEQDPIERTLPLPSMTRKERRKQEIGLDKMRATANMAHGQAIQLSECVALIRRSYRYVFGVLFSLMFAYISLNLSSISVVLANTAFWITTVSASVFTILLVWSVTRLSAALPKAIAEYTLEQ